MKYYILVAYVILFLISRGFFVYILCTHGFCPNARSIIYLLLIKKKEVTVVIMVNCSDLLRICSTRLNVLFTINLVDTRIVEWLFDDL